MERKPVYVAAGEEQVPGLLLLPSDAQAGVPGVLLLHGFNSRKERMADALGDALAKRGVVSLAIDLPLHGAREGSVQGLSVRNPLAVVQKWKLAVREAHAALAWLAARAEVDPMRIAIAAYSLGSFLAAVVAADNARVRAVVLAAGGDLPEQTPFAGLVRTVADPLRAVRSLRGRPLLMINGRHDRTVTPEQAQRLFDAARDPKELKWHHGGHSPPPHITEWAAAWLCHQLHCGAAHPKIKRVRAS